MKEIEDLSKSDASEGNNSRNLRDELLMDPRGEAKNYNSFEKRSLASRFLSRLKSIGGRFKGHGKSDRKESDFPDEQDAEEYSNEDIIFPKIQKSAASNKKKKGSPLGKAIKWSILLGTAFFIGHLARPEVIEKTRETLKTWSTFTVKKFEPLKAKVEEKVTKMVEKKSSATETPGKKIKYWKAPMTAGFTSDKPGKSPMGMDLIPVYEDEEQQSGEGFRINPTVVQNIGVKTVKVRRRTLSREIRTTGILAYDERTVTQIHTKYKGWVEKLYVDFTGQEVGKGDLLAEVYSPELVSTQEELLVAMKYSQSLKDSPFTEIGKGAERLFESTKRRLELFDVPEHQIEELIREKKITKTLHIHSPFRGFVIKKHASEGMFVEPGMSLYTIADLSNIWVLADVYEYEMPWIKIGQKVKMNLSYYPGKKFHGKVTYIDPFMDSKTRTLKVRMEFKNPKWKLKPDMYANVTLKSAIARKSVAVPEEAVIHSGERQIVIVQDSSGGFDSRSLTLGVQADGYYQVLKGLKAGETVVTSSSFLLDSESRLKEALSKMQTKKKEERPKAVVKKKAMDMSKMGNKDMGEMDQKGMQKKIPGVIEIQPDLPKK